MGAEDRGHKLFSVLSVHIRFKLLKHFYSLTWAFPVRLVWETDVVSLPLRAVLHFMVQFSLLGNSVMPTPPKELSGPVLDCDLKAIPCCFSI